MSPAGRQDAHAQHDEQIEQAARAATHALGAMFRAVFRTCRHDYAYVAAYAMVITAVRLGLHVRLVAHVNAPWNHHQGIPLVAVAGAVGVLAAVLRDRGRPSVEKYLTVLRRQAEGVIAGLSAPADGPQPSVKINRAGRTGVESVVLSQLPYRMAADGDVRTFEELWAARVPAVSDDGAWRFAWDLHNNQVTITPYTPVPLPSKVELTASDAPNGLALRLGQSLSAKDEPEWVWWDPNAADPHLLVVGPTRSGKSVALRCLLAQAIAGGWQILIADPKGVDYRWADGLPGVMRSAGDDAFTAIDTAVAEMKRRQAWMEDHAPRTAANLGEVAENPFVPCLVLIDETAELLELGGEGEPKEKKQRMAQTAEELGSLARRSRFVQMVMCVATQRPDAKIIAGEVRGNLGTRLLTGEGEQQHKLMAFGQTFVARLPANYPSGRGRVMVGGGEPRELQVPWITVQDIIDAHETPATNEPASADVFPEEWVGAAPPSSAPPRITSAGDDASSPADEREEPADAQPPNNIGFTQPPENGGDPPPFTEPKRRDPDGEDPDDEEEGER